VLGGEGIDVGIGRFEGQTLELEQRRKFFENV